MGEIISNRKTKDIIEISYIEKYTSFEDKNIFKITETVYKDYKDIDLGIHVFLSLEQATSTLSYEEDVVVPVYCKKEDLVAVGWFDTNKKYDCNSAVFMKVTLRKRDFERAINKKIFN